MSLNKKKSTIKETKYLQSNKFIPISTNIKNQ